VDDGPIADGDDCLSGDHGAGRPAFWFLLGDQGAGRLAAWSVWIGGVKDGVYDDDDDDDDDVENGEVVLAVDGPIADCDDCAGMDPETVVLVTLGGVGNGGGLWFVCGETLDIHENGGDGGGGGNAVLGRGGDHGALRVVGLAGNVLNMGGGNPDAVMGGGTAVLLLLGTVEPPHTGNGDDDEDAAL
jgi:hypothetical protein